MLGPIARILGTPTINPVAFAIGKLGLVVVAALPLLQLAGVRIAEPVPGLEPLAAVLAAAGVVVLLVASRALGSALRVGLPQEETVLQTSGIYRFSRHPIYLSIFFLGLASCLYCPHPVVIVGTVVVVAIHHTIALAEERFLEQRFGEAWLRHKARVPRYLGLPKTTGSRGDE